MIQRVAIVGAGTMGLGLAQLCSQQGFSVKLHDSFPEALSGAPRKLKQALDHAVLKGRLTPLAAERSFQAVGLADSLEGLFGADLVIEAVSEDLGAKRRVFKELGRICPEAILATNTSSLSVSAIAEAVSEPRRVLGMHFFNPPVALRLVEMARTPRTSPEVFQAAWDFALLGLRKTPVDVKDTPGFIVNRVMRPYYLEAQRAALEGAGISELDRAARESGGVPMGPFELMDLIGLEVNLAITRSLYEALGRPERLRPQPLQERLVALGHWGRKTGKGFYLYEDQKPVRENPEAISLLPQKAEGPSAAAWGRVSSAVIAEARRAFEEGVAGKADINTAIRLAMNFPKGPFEWQEQGAGKSSTAD